MIDAIVGLVPDPRRGPTPYKRSLDYVFTFPPQEFRLDRGDAEHAAVSRGERLHGSGCRPQHVDDDGDVGGAQVAAREGDIDHAAAP